MGGGTIQQAALIAAAVLACHCGSAPSIAPEEFNAVVQPQKEPALPTLTLAPPEDRSSLLLTEAFRELQMMRSTRYRHETRVDESRGRFEYDCSGFLNYALRAALPDAIASMPVTSGASRPLAEDFISQFVELRGAPGERWARVTPNAMAPGDVIAWTRSDDRNGDNTGHVAIVLERPALTLATPEGIAIGGRFEYRVRVVDSAETPHSDDSRADRGRTGLGVGTIGVVTDGDAAIGYRWRAVESTTAFATEVVIARAR